MALLGGYVPVLLDATCGSKWRDHGVEVRLKKKGDSSFVSSPDLGELMGIHSRYTMAVLSRLGDELKFQLNAPIVRPPVYDAMEGTLVKTIRPDLPH
jgi:hypothetical protein